MSKIKNSITTKLIIIGALSLILLIPTLMIEDLIYEREQRKINAQNEVSEKWGDIQTVAGPVISIPYNHYSKNEKEQIIKSVHYIHFLPESLHVKSNLTTEKRKRGIYELVVYNTKIKMSGKFDQLSFDNLNIPNEDILLNDALLSIGISDMRGIKNMVEIKLNDSVFTANPGILTKDLFHSGISIKPDLIADEMEYTFEIELDLNGSKQLSFLPVGKMTTAQINSDWNNPSFNGSFLPDKRTISEEGFYAKWKVLHLNRNYPQRWTGSQFNIHQSEFGVGLLLKVDEYQKMTRTTKYALMFISLTFLSFFMIELLGKKMVHPVQYLLVGLGLLVFYTLLLSLTEHINFDLSYLLAGGAITALISLYTISVFKDKRFTLLILGVLILLYGYLYIVLQLQDYALLMGSIGLFVILALVMYLTRNINWFLPNKFDESNEN